MKNKFFLLIALLAALHSGCKQAGSQEPGVLSPENLEKNLAEKLITASDGDLIRLPEGAFSFDRSLSLEGVSNITIEGMGMGKTVLSFKDQIEGAQGLLVKGVDGLTLKGFTVQDTKGDAIKVQASQNVTFREIGVTWTEGAKPENGGYGLYPVDCKNVLIEHCEASYASDAGIYVGQSTGVIVRNNYAHHNVAGIEIENTRNADVYGNTAKDNTGGLLIFDMPDLPQANGWKVSVHDNQVENNNHPNFAVQGSVVSILPPGSGIVIMAHREVDVFKNSIKNHSTIGLSIISWLFTGRPVESKEYDPFCSAVHIHDNVFEGNKGQVDTTTDFGRLIAAVTQGQTVDIATDGIFNLADQVTPGLCLRNNGAVRFLNLRIDRGNTPEAIARNMSDDLAPFDCSLPAIDLTGSIMGVQ